MPSGRPSIRRVALAVSLIAGAAGAYFGLAYLQSPDGFQEFVLPLAKHWLRASALSAETGRFSLDGKLRVTDLHYEDAERGLRLDLASGRLDLSLRSVLSDGLVEITTLELREPTLVIGNRIRTPSPSPPTSVASLPDAPAIARWLLPFRVPLTFGHSLIESFEISIEDDGRTRAKIGPGDLELARGTSDHGIEVQGRTLVLVAPDEEARRYAGEVTFSFDVGRSQHGTVEQMAGRAEWQLLTPELRGDTPLKGRLAVETTLSDDDRANLQLELSVEQKRRTLGQLAISLGRTGDEGRRLAGALAIDGLEAEALNPLLAFFGIGQLATGRAHGSASAHSDILDNHFELAVDLDARDVSRLLSDGGHAPAIGLHGRLRSGWEGGTEDLEFEALDLALVRADIERLNVSLDRPYRLQRGRQDEDGPALPTELLVHVNQLEIRDLKRLTSAFDVQAWRDVASAELSGDLTARLREAGRDIAFRGHLRATDLRLAGDPFAEMPALDLDTNVVGRVRDLRAVDLEEVELALLKGERSVATGQLTGRAGGGIAEFSGVVHSDDLLGTLETLELRDLVPARWLTFGVLDASYRSRFDSSQILLESAFSFDGVVLDAGNEPVALPRVQLQGTVQWPRQSHEIRFSGLTVNLQGDDGEEVARGKGLLTPSESREGRDARFELHLESVAAARWLTLLGIPIPKPGPLPLNGDVVISVTDATTVHADVTTLLQPQPGAPASEPIALALEVDLGRSGGAPLQIEAFVQSERDELMLDALYDASTQPRKLEIKAQSPHLELERYLALRDPKPAIPPSRAQDALDAVTDDAETLAAAAAEATGPTPPRTALALDLTLDELLYRGLTLREARIGGGHRDDVLVLDLQASQLEGGLIEGALARTRSGDFERYELQLRTRSVELAPLIKAASGSEESSNFRGRLDLTTALRARHRIGTPLRKWIQGDILFRVRDAQLRSDRRFNRELLLRTDLRQLVFSEADGHLRVAKDQIEVLAAHLEGSMATVDLTGTITLDWDVEALYNLRANPGVSALSAIGLSREGIFGRIVDLTTVPVEIKATGRLGNLEYSSRPLPPDVLQPAEDNQYGRKLVERLDDVFGR